MPEQIQKDHEQEERSKPVEAPAFISMEIEPVDELLEELQKLRDKPCTEDK